MSPQLPIVAIATLAIFGGTARAGHIVGTISATKPAVESASESGGAYQSRRYKFLEQIDYSELRDYIVSVEGIERPVAEGAARPLASVAQRNGMFEPSILPIMVGTEVEFPNRDEIYHNVFSMSEVRPFDLGMYKSTDSPKRIVFDKPGQIDIFCAIHSQMHCVIRVMPNPWFSLSDKKGRFEIKNVPAGTYKLKVWHQRLPVKYIEIEVPESGPIELTVEMGFSDLPKI